MAARRKAKPGGAARRKTRQTLSRRRRLFAVCWKLALFLAVPFLLFLLHAHSVLVDRLSGPVWVSPLTIESEAWDLEPGADYSLDRLVRRLHRSGYVEARSVDTPGQLRHTRGRLTVWPLQQDIGAPLSLRFRRNRILSLRDSEGDKVDRWRLPPEPIAILYGDARIDREVIALDRIPQVLVDAVLTAEDSRFYEHNGVDVRAILRASVRNVKAHRIVQGGSTITQQTVKNLFLDSRRTWWRKAREAVMALMLEARESKERILELYLNELYLGQRGSVSICGVGAASKFYFDKPVERLTLGEAAMLAGIIRSPGRYNPYRHPQRALARRDQVLDDLLAADRIDVPALERARAERPRYQDGGIPPRAAPWAVDFIVREAAHRFGEELFRTGGGRLTTTLDGGLQRAAEEALDSTLRQFREGESLEGAIVVLDPRDGALLALVGGRDYAHSQFDRAVQARRQPGSLFKPFVYAAAFEDTGDGATTPATLLNDEPLEIITDGKLWAPRNYDREFHGPMTAREALVQSRNVPTVGLAQRVGLDRVVDEAKRLGIDSTLLPLPSLALGTSEVTPLELTTAYATLASGGIRRSTSAVRAWIDSEGKERHVPPADGDRVLDERVAFLVNDILADVFDNGTAQSARANGFRGLASGKTGTTDDLRDSWFVGYTPEWVALVWVGADDHRGTGKTGATGALAVWTSFIKRAGLAEQCRPFLPPPGVVRQTIDLDSGDLARVGCLRTTGEWFLKGTEPQYQCDLHSGGMRRWFRRWREQRRRGGDPI